jgi:hypothetical protein
MHETENNGRPRPDSQAADEAGYLEEKCGELYRDPGGSISTVVSFRMTVALDNLHGTAKLFLPRETGIFSVWSTGRSFFEMAGTAYWLTDPDINADDRLGRVMNERLVSLDGSRHLIERGLGPVEKGDPNFDELFDQEVVQRIDLLVDRFTDLGYEPTKDRRQVKPVRPSLSDLVDDVSLRGMYSLLSTYSHGEIWAVTHHQRDVRFVTDSDGRERRLAAPSVFVSEYQLLARAMHQAFGKAVLRIVEYNGWPAADFAEAYVRATVDLGKGATTPALERMLGEQPYS